MLSATKIDPELAKRIICGKIVHASCVFVTLRMVIGGFLVQRPGEAKWPIHK